MAPVDFPRGFARFRVAVRDGLGARTDHQRCSDLNFTQKKDRSRDTFIIVYPSHFLDLIIRLVYLALFCFILPCHILSYLV